MTKIFLQALKKFTLNIGSYQFENSREIFQLFAVFRKKVTMWRKQGWLPWCGHQYKELWFPRPPKNDQQFVGKQAMNLEFLIWNSTLLLHLILVWQLCIGCDPKQDCQNPMSKCHSSISHLHHIMYKIWTRIFSGSLDDASPIDTSC